MAEIISTARGSRGPGPGLSHWLGTKFINQPLAMEAGYAARLQAAIKDRAFEPEIGFAGGVDGSKYHGDKVGSSGYRVTDDHIAILPVQGMLIDRGEWLGDRGGWATSYEGLAEQLRRVAKDDTIKTVVLDIDSGGGMVAGLFDVAREIERLKASKKVVAVAANAAYSAAYAIACVAHEVYVSRSGGTGSIGVISTHTSYAEMLASAGLEATIIHAGSHKPNGNPYQALSHLARSEMSDTCDALYEQFCAHVARHRKMDVAAVKATEARVYLGENGVKAGLADGVKSFEEVLEAIRKGSAPSAGGTGKKGRKMTDTTAGRDLDQVIAAALTSLAASSAAKQTPPQAAPAALVTAVAPAVIAQPADARARFKAILSCDAAKARPVLAQHLALETDVSPEAAVLILGAAAIETTEATATATAPGAAADALSREMANRRNSGGVKPESNVTDKSASAHRPKLGDVFKGRIGKRSMPAGAASRH